MTVFQWLAAAIGAAALVWFLWGWLRPYTDDERKQWRGDDEWR